MKRRHKTTLALTARFLPSNYSNKMSSTVFLLKFVLQCSHKKKFIIFRAIQSFILPLLRTPATKKERLCCCRLSPIGNDDEGTGSIWTLSPDCNLDMVAALRASSLRRWFWWRSSKISAQTVHIRLSFKRSAINIMFCENLWQFASAATSYWWRATS